MKIAIDMSPLKSGHYLQHRVRGTGFYLRNLQSSLEKYHLENKYVYFNRGDSLREGVDIVHYPYFEPFFLTLPVFSQKKRIVTVHDLTPLVFPDHFKAGLKGNLKWQVQKLALKNMDAIIAVSNSSKEDIVKYAGVSGNRIRVIYEAAGEEFKQVQSSKLKIQSLKRKYGLPDRFALYVGDVTWNKNLPRLIEAAVKVDVPLAMVGKALIDKITDAKNPWNTDLIRSQKLAEKHKNIFRLGFVSSEDLVALYNAATLFVMPSIYEGFGLPVLESMSCGCPVVTSRRGSVEEVVGDAGVYVDPFNVDSIAGGISEVFNNRNLRIELSQKGLIQSKKFTWKKTADETIKAYRDIIGPR